MSPKPRRWLLLAGAIVTVASSAVIEVCLVLFFTPVSAEPLRVLVLIGIGGVGVGSLSMWFSSRFTKQ
jgi:flavin reductase (DIM6/NTAB) family NADH-FMN oxidoreductase RutF